MEELDSLALLVLEGGSDLQADHPGFHDETYRKRRQEIAQYAENFKLFCILSLFLSCFLVFCNYFCNVMSFAYKRVFCFLFFCIVHLGNNVHTTHDKQH